MKARYFLFSIWLGVLVFGLGGLSVRAWSQEAAGSSSNSNSESVSAETATRSSQSSSSTRSLLDLYRTGGLVMHPLALASILMVAISLYLQRTLARNRLMPPEELAAYREMLVRQELAEALRYARERDSLLSLSLTAALAKANFERDLFNKTAMETAASDAIYHEEGKWMGWVQYLNVIATLAPMLGLLGTVTGMIASFEQLKAGKTTPTDLAGGIGEAMIATASGLFLAIPAMFLFFHYRNRLSHAMGEVGQWVGRLLDLFIFEGHYAESEAHPHPRMDSSHSGSTPFAITSEKE